MDSKLYELKEKLDLLCEKHNVEALYVFGSAARQQVAEDSDFDFIVRFQPSIPLLDFADNYFEMHVSLENLLNRKVDLLTENSLKNPVFSKEVFSTRVPVYEKQSA